MAYTTIDKPTDYFEAKIHSGTGVAKTLAFDFEVDMFITKMRNDAYPVNLYDVVRGNNIQARINGALAERVSGATISFGNSSGISIGSDSGNYGVNQATIDDGVTTATYGAWGWKAGGSATSNSNGSITSSVSANTTSGFSIVKYVATGSNATVGHGLNEAPNLIIVKGRATANNWRVGSDALTSWTYRINLEGTDSEVSQANVWNSTAPTSTVFSIGTSSSVNDTTGDGEHMAYCFQAIKGYSKFGTYVGNGSTDGPFVYLGFKPAFLIQKKITNASGDNWHLYDNKRDTANPFTKLLLPNSSSTELTGNAIDFLSNGFKVRVNNNGTNSSGNTNLYLAFAQHPFVTSTGVPATAR